MKIQRNHSTRINKGSSESPPAKRQKASASESRKPVRKDAVKLSSRSDEARRLTELAKLVPDVRWEKIDAIKKQIKAGTYSIPADSVARSIADLHKKLKRDDK